MKHLKRFKTFESVNLEDWETIVDVLQSDIFDEWNIHKIKDEIFDGNENENHFCHRSFLILFSLVLRLKFSAENPATTPYHSS